jgi:hypothetical protein
MLDSGDEYVVYEPQRVKSIQLYSSDTHKFTGTLQVSADGHSGTGRSFNDYPVKIIKVHERPSYTFSILLGDTNSNQLGWTDSSTLKL